MTTPLIIVGLLLVPYLALRAWASLTHTPANTRLGGLIGLSLAFAFFSIGHFVQTAPMSAMLPPWVPYRMELIYATGIVELVLAAALLIPGFSRCAGWACIAVLVLFFPANVYAAFNHVGMGGHLWGPTYLLIRAPLQLILIGWAYAFAARSERPTAPEGRGG